jgi:hypothetical protein
MFIENNILSTIIQTNLLNILSKHQLARSERDLDLNIIKV